MLIQAAIQDMSIWPGDVLGWLQLLGAVLVISGGTLGVAWKMIDKRFHHLDTNKVSQKDFDSHLEDFKKAETQVHKNESRLDSAEYKMQGFDYKHERVSNEISMVNESVKALEKLFRTQQENTSKEISRMTEAVIRLEGAVLGPLALGERRTRPARSSYSDLDKEE